MNTKEKVCPGLICIAVSGQLSLFRMGGRSNGVSRKENAETAGRAVLRFRRDRKICNRAELTRLQRNFDSCVAEIDALEQSKRSGAVDREPLLPESWEPRLWPVRCSLLRLNRRWWFSVFYWRSPVLPDGFFHTFYTGRC